MVIKGKLQNRYQIINPQQPLGSGGFGDTYLAQDLSLPGAPYCVVKHLRPKDPDPQVVQIAQKLFNEEAKTLYKLGKNDQIPRLYAHFQEEGEFYLVQEFIEGDVLSKKITPGKRLSERETIRLLQEILEVLAVVHEEKVIHRDLKPENIMRRQDGRLVLIDFGAVKQIKGLTSNSQRQPNVTVGIGTEGYMPNEQSNGNPELASDIYAVGMIGIQALTGEEPVNLLRDPNNRQIIWSNQVQVSDRLRSFLDKMVHEYHRSRYQKASEALQELNKLIPSPSKSQPWLISVGLAVVAITGIVVTTAIVVRNVLPSIRSPQPPAPAPSRYTQLEEHLEAGEWREADRETYEVMLKVSGVRKLESEDLKNFSCPDLQEIDRLWVKYSQGRFGFSVQKRIWKDAWLKALLKGDRAEDFLEDSVGWRENGRTKRLNEINFGLEAPPGHLPALQAKIWSKQQGGFSLLFKHCPL